MSSGTVSSSRSAERDTAVGVEARRQIERHGGNARRVHHGDELGREAGHLAAEPGSEERVDRHGGDVRARLRLAGALTFSSELLPIDMAIRAWSRRDQAVAEHLRRVDNRRMDYLRLLFGAICRDEDEAEARSVLAFSLVIGHHFMAADHGARSHADMLELAARWLLA